MNFAFASATPINQLCTLFNTAFSDYLLPVVLTQPVMEVKLSRDGTDLALSPLAMRKGEPAGFIFNSVGMWQGKKNAYNGGTGVVPKARGRALTEKMYQFCLPHLQEQAVEQCLLEVVQENQRAFRIYKSLGFEVSRVLRCFRQPKALLQWHGNALPPEVSLHQVPRPNWLLYQSFWEVEPSWQHHTAAIDRSLAYVQVVEAQVAGSCVGYGIIYGLTGALAQLAVAPHWRGKGIGQALLRKLELV